ncbi:MAG: ATP-binding protein [Candidatus Synechococcus spongiarum SP3]|uniref:ATP-binding protein n=1 Tax=Candidatus Synechococcus spongiarum SP3 TaxID=1604020 RepID=A0A0G2HLF6_9SYNE|nr:MAG: ATP-binding protein [Candidatus Synechococcus spongiarum SP3]
MLGSLRIKNFTAFKAADLTFATGLNVIVGANGTGKSHLLKLPYALMAMSVEEGKKRSDPPTKTLLQNRIAEKIAGVFRPEERLGHLVHRQRGRNKCEVTMGFAQPGACLAFQFSSLARSEVVVTNVPSGWQDKPPVFLPTRELLTFYPGFVSLYETRYLEFDETWRDTCLLLGAPALRGPRERAIACLIEPLEQQLGGKIVLDSNGRFYLQRFNGGKMEMPLVAEGWRKLAMLVRLIATGSLLDKGCLFWDEPEANLNPRLIREIARAILGVCTAGVQVFVATHSLFLLRELEILLKQDEFAAVKKKKKYFALRPGDDGVVDVSQADDIGDADPLLLLDEDLEQSDRFVDQFMSREES